MTRLKAVCNHDCDGYPIELADCEICDSNFDVCARCRRVIFSCDCGHYDSFDYDDDNDETDSEL
jgi:hypothetical protein